MATFDQSTDHSPRTFRQKVLAWAWNAINATMGGAATAGGAAMAGAAIGAANFTQRQILSMVIAGAATALFNYIRTNRLPPMFDGDDKT